MCWRCDSSRTEEEQVKYMRWVTKITNNARYGLIGVKDIPLINQKQASEACL